MSGPRIRLVSLEDGITATGFRKIAAYVERLNPDTHVHYVSTTDRYRSFWKSLSRRFAETPDWGDDQIEEIARGLADADIVALSSMSGYADLTKRVAARVREIAPRAFIVWGGIHPIIYPEDAITAEVDAICTGEGEFAFEELYDLLRRGADYRAVRNFWFKDGDEVIRNPFRPLQTNLDLARMPFPKYGGDELIYRQGRGFEPVTRRDYLENNGLSYPAIWSIGCPLHCTFCGNTVFIANDKNYARIRHSGPDYIVDEVRQARRVHPHLSVVQFYDDSFLAIPLRQLEEFAAKWRAEVGLPFAVYGVIPTYVRRDKLEVLTWAGLNRIRMGIQSGSERILKFYKRPTPVPKVEKAVEVISQFSKIHINPSYDIIVDNPVETRQDVIDTLELVWRMKRPFTLNIFSLRVIPNTTLEKQMREAGLDLETINANYHAMRPSFANVLLYLLILWKLPRPLFDRLLRHVRAYGEEQRQHRILIRLVRIPWLVSQGLRHLRLADFSTITGRAGYWLWRLGLVSLWLRWFGPDVRRIARRESWRVPADPAESSP